MAFKNNQKKYMTNYALSKISPSTLIWKCHDTDLRSPWLRMGERYYIISLGCNALWVLDFAYLFHLMNTLLMKKENNHINSINSKCYLRF